MKIIPTNFDELKYEIPQNTKVETKIQSKWTNLLSIIVVTVPMKTVYIVKNNTYKLKPNAITKKTSKFESIIKIIFYISFSSIFSKNSSSNTLI
jgi:hypothetical protein